MVCTPETIPTFSAVAYYFGRKIHKDLNQPVGLIQSAWGGTAIESWISKEKLSTDPDFDIVSARIENYAKAYLSNLEDYEKKLEKWQQQAEQAKKRPAPVP